MAGLAGLAGLAELVPGTQICYLGGLGSPFWCPGGPFRGAGVPQGHPLGHLGVQVWIFIDFGWIWGPCWEAVWRHLGDFFVIGTTADAKR